VEKQHVIFLTVCGTTTYQLIRNLVAPGKPTEHPLDELIRPVEDHRAPKLSVTMLRFKFNLRTQSDRDNCSVHGQATMTVQACTVSSVTNSTICCMTESSAMSKTHIYYTPLPLSKEVLFCLCCCLQWQCLESCSFINSVCVSTIASPSLSLSLSSCQRLDALLVCSCGAHSERCQLALLHGTKYWWGAWLRTTSGLQHSLSAGDPVLSNGDAIVEHKPNLWARFETLSLETATETRRTSLLKGGGV